MMRRPDSARPFARGVQLLLSLAWLGFGVVTSACDEKNGQKGPEQSATPERDPVTGLTAPEAAEVLATVGNRSITLGEYAASLSRMDRFERVRYQSQERQKELLSEMIEVEILAQEARRRGLDKDPVVELRTTQALRDELLQELKRRLPKPEELSEREVREYYEAHRSELSEPERRRVLVLALDQPALAAEVTEKAQGASGEAWAELARRYSLDKRGLEPGGAPELAGDLGFVSAPGETRGQNAEVPEPVRAAVFSLAKLGDVTKEPIAVGGRHYVVRLGGTSPARDRSLRDAEGAIRAELLRQRYLEAEKKLYEELAKKYPVSLDREAIDRAAAPAKKAP